MTNSIIVIADKPGGGVTDLPHTLEIERGERPSGRRRSRPRRDAR